jgi:hypothetical protein
MIMQMQEETGQLRIAFGWSAEELRQHLEGEVGRPVSLVVTDNASTMLSFTKRQGLLQVRLHRMFLGAGPDVLSEIASFLRTRRGPLPQFRKFIREKRTLVLSKPVRKASLRSAGRWHDLQELFDAVNRDYFSGSVTAAITWSSCCPRSSVRKRTLGSFSERSNLIRINAVLDRKAVPRYYLAFIVYHEMLHAAMGVELRGGRRSMHSCEFRRREKLYVDYEKAIAWETGRS